MDYRNLNKMTIRDAYPLPCISNNLDKLQGSTIFSMLDASAAYHTIPVEPKTQPLLAFVTPWGLYTFLRMPFGAMNAGATYSRFIELLVGRLRSPWILAYLDDVITHTKSMEDHLIELKKVFEAH